MANLVIVESPAKAKTIGRYLGSDYIVKASMGHLRDLPKSQIGVDIENDFTPKYIGIRGKEKLIKELKADAKKSDHVYLATDPDREGEAIAWHLCKILELDEKDEDRVTFNEITKGVVTTSIKQPRAIDMDLVDAQQARRILDRIVGYQLSPLLWKKVRYGLSAGRVQSVCTKMIVDRENEIRNFVPEEYWTLEAVMYKDDEDNIFVAKFVGKNGKKLELHSEEEVKALLADLQNYTNTVNEVKKAQKKRNPAPPFTTSTLQQDASRKLGMTTKKTMAVAQQLYEGVNIPGHGLTGLITYMRTDSIRLSGEAVASARGFIKDNYGDSFCPEKPRFYKSKNAIQDAHEAIRPSNVHFVPDEIKSSLTADQYKLYRLIWSRFVACQMESAVYDTLTINIGAGPYLFRAASTQLHFPGYIKLYGIDADDDDAQENNRLPELQEGDSLNVKEYKQDQHFTQPPARYTEATLVKAMEENGVGRPSTYAPTVSLIQDREYVKKENKALCPTPLGEVVTGLMDDEFKDIVDVSFTANMEETLDEVEEGKKNWKEVLREFYKHFSEELGAAEQDLQEKHFKVPDEETDIVCEKCGRKMVIKSGRFGKFLACPGYPECKNTKPYSEPTPGECPLCGAQILKKKSKNGYTYYGCSRNPDCGFMTWDVPQKDHCPECGKTLFKISGRGAKKAFCTNDQCSLFVPEDQRGYRPRKAKAESSEDQKTTKETAKKTAKKTTTKKTTRKSTKAKGASK